MSLKSSALAAAFFSAGFGNISTGAAIAVILILFTITFAVSAIVTYKFKRKNSNQNASDEKGTKNEN